jgi:hypothetical protein
MSAPWGSRGEGAAAEEESRGFPLVEFGKDKNFSATPLASLEASDARSRASIHSMAIVPIPKSLRGRSCRTSCLIRVAGCDAAIKFAFFSTSKESRFQALSCSTARWSAGGNGFSATGPEYLATSAGLADGLTCRRHEAYHAERTSGWIVRSCSQL